MKTTAAARLHATIQGILEKNPNTNKMAKDALATGLKLDAAKPTFLQAISGLLDLTDGLLKVITESKQMTTHARSVYASALNAIRQAFTLERILRNWNDICTENLNPNNLNVLMLLDDALKAFCVEPTIEKERLDSWIGEFNELNREILAADDLPVELRATISSQILSVLNCLAHFALFGVTGLKERVSQGIGLIIVDFEKYSAVKKDGRMRKYLKLMGEVAGLIRTTGSTSKAIKDISELPKLLGFGPE